MTIVADLLVPFCDAASLNIKDASKTVKKRFIISISFVDNALLHQNLFKDQYLDWNGVQEYLVEISYTVSDWIQLLKILDFTQEIIPAPEVAELISTTFAGVRVSAAQTKNLNPMESLRMCFAKVKINPSWDLLCKTFLACNLLDIDQVQILQALFINECMAKEQTPIENNIRELVRFMASCKHTKAEYADVFSNVLDDSRCQVRSHVVIQSLKKRESLREAKQTTAILSGAAYRKPSLTQLLEKKLLIEGAQHPQDSFASFCRASNLASNVNLRVKQTAYFLLCLPDYEMQGTSKATELSRIVGGDRIILSNIQSMNILSPDLQELRKIIMDTHYTTKPSEALRNFKDKCVGNCIVMTGKLNWTTVMRLYMAAYCRQSISKDLWCYVLTNSLHFNSTPSSNSLLIELGSSTSTSSSTANSSASFLHHTSSETESTVQSFVKANPMVLHELIEIMLFDL